MTPRYALSALGLAIVTSACAGGGTAPSISGEGSSTGFLAGTWAGTLSVTSQQGVSVASPVTVIFATMPQTSGTTYNATIASSNPLLPIHNTGTATALPSSAPALFSLDQNYLTLSGCGRGNFSAFGQVVTQDHIDSDVSGYQTCDNLTYRGRLTLDRTR